ncbi:MAG: type III pantothenate kinase [Pirellulaceae bacterium]
MKNYLAVDIGNSGLRIASLDLVNHSVAEPLRINWRHDVVGGQLQIRRDSDREDRFPPDDPAWLSLIDDYLLTLNGPARWLVASVRHDAANQLEAHVAHRQQDHFQRVTHADVPLIANVEFPQRVGIDRLLAAWAATAATELRPLIVIQAGSAVTVDLVARGADGRDAFEGGAILPGVPMMLRLLGKAADLLPQIDADDLIDLPPLPGKNTEAAMTCGAASGLIGGVQHLVNRYREANGAATPVILSGGDGVRLLPYISQPLVAQSQLVLRGLLRLALELQLRGADGETAKLAGQ